jgi:hypothetical protein
MPPLTGRAGRSRGRAVVMHHMPRGEAEMVRCGICLSIGPDIPANSRLLECVTELLLQEVCQRQLC